MLSYFLSGHATVWGTVFTLFGYAVLIFVLLPAHEFAHAYTADRLGDTTPRYYGRLTLNPLAHLDWMGALMLVLCGFGYAKPVPINPAHFRDPKKGTVLTALAGPVSNLLMAAVSLGLFRLLLLITGGGVYAQNGYLYFSSDALYYGYIFLVNVLAGINIGLAVFNLLPIPPLDGYRVFGALFPPKWRYYIDRYQRYIAMAAMVLILTGALDVPLAWLRRVIGGALCFVFGMPNLFG